MSKVIDLTGQRFGRLTVIERAENRVSPKGKQYSKWLCKCDCGNVVEVSGGNLKSSNTQSCGCFCVERSKTSNTTHGKRQSTLYKKWVSMKSRCHYQTNKDYRFYGERGITVCDEWLNDFQAFYDWAMSNGYADNLTIDRIDGTKGYSPDNCRWVSMKEQQNNRRNNHLITYNGKTQTLQQWADEKHKKSSTLRMRLKSGWTIERTLNTP